MDKKLIAVMILLVLLGSPIWSEDKKQKETTRLLINVSPTKKLSSSLHLLMATDAALVGVTKGGTLVDVPTAKLKDVEEKLKKLDAKVTRGRLPPAQYVDELILSYPVGAKVTEAALADRGYKVLETHKAEDQILFLVKPTKVLNAKTLKVLTGDSDLAHAELNKPIQLPPLTKVVGAGKTTALTITNDPGLPRLWGMKNIQADIAWKKGLDSPITVAVIDTGADLDHEDLKDLKGNFVPGYNFLTNSPDGQDDNGHGTHVCGTIGAIGNNCKGVVGVCSRVKIMPLKFLDKKRNGSTFNAVKAIDYARNKGAQIMSNSWTGLGYSQALFDAIGRANKGGILFVTAAGNDGNNNDVARHYPASYRQPNILTVAAIDINEKLWSSSDYGKTSVHLGAPGVGIYSTMLKAGPLSDSSGYGYLSGTSMATAHVAGAAALILGRVGHAKDKAPALKKALLDNVRKIPSLRNKCSTEGTLDIAFLK